MPSVEMRRSTRVFVPKAKDGELVRVLRSGRRLWVESAEVKHRGGKNGGDDWFPLISDGGKCKQQKINGWHEDVNPRSDPMDVDEQNPKPKPEPEPEISDRVPSFREPSNYCKPKMFRNVYSRKRKRYNVRNSGDSGSKKFGLHFVRRQRRKGEHTSCVEKKQADDDGIVGFTEQGLLSVFVDSSFAGCLFSSVLSSLLRYLSKERVGLLQLSTFLLSSPVSPAFSSAGIHFLWNCMSNKRKGLCRISGVREFIAMFTLDYTAAPLCFLHLHATMLFRSVRVSCICWSNFERKNESTDETLAFVDVQSEESPSDRLVAPAKDEPKDVKIVNSSPSGASKLCSQNVRGRIGVLTRSASKRRRRSLRSRRARNPLPIVLHKSPGPSVSNHVSKKKAHPALPLACKQELWRSVRKNSVSDIPLQKPDLSSLHVDPDSQCCTANILIVEADRCYRVEGAEVRLDSSASNEWLLAIKTDGTTKYSLKIQKEMRPCTTNRYTHALIWASENGWKLEFPERKDWTVFKELYKVCGERNYVPTSPGVKIIPVPWVCEVTNSWDSPGAFVRPDSYIRTTNDELSRTLSRKTANYDMDSEDDEWLRKLNSELETSNHFSEENFELAIDSFEKASYCNQEDVNDEKTAAKLCLDLAIPDVAEQIYKYWMKKRKQRRNPLIRVFQLNQPTRSPLITKPVLRKKRSLKRQNVQPMHRGRGKDSSVLQVIAAEHNAAEEQTAVLRIQEAVASADKSVELAILKRQRAQILMENADLAIYRATMALRIADAAAEILDTQQAADHFLE